MKIKELEPLARKAEFLKNVEGAHDIYEEIAREASDAANDFMGRQLCRKVISMCHPKGGWGDRLVRGFPYPKWPQFMGALADVANDCGEAINSRGNS